MSHKPKPLQADNCPLRIAGLLIVGFCMVAALPYFSPAPEPCHCPAELQQQLQDMRTDIAELVEGFEALDDGYQHLRPDASWCKSQIDKQRGRLECLDVRVTGLEQQAAEAKVWEAYYRDYAKFIREWAIWFAREYGPKPKGR